MDASSNASEHLVTLKERVDAFLQDPDIVWGARAIGEVLGLNARDTHHFLAWGRIKPARKVGGKWCASKRELAYWIISQEADKK
jgi:hypothetical protein